MEGISQGVTLGGRYTLDRALSSRDGVEQWIATDTTLGREVTLTAFPSSGPHAAAAMDSARRVASVEDHRLVRVLDVGDDDEINYVVEEAVHHSDSVAALLREDTIPAEEIRRIVGEAASGLETARARGLHHLILTPHHVLRARDGSVTVSGVAIGAALDGRDDDDASDTSREDVTALVSVVYAGLTGEWPGPDEVPGVPSVSRRADGQVPAPSELVDSVPGDLDTLCRTTLNDDKGPATPGELARQLSPWSAEQVYAAGGRPPSRGTAAAALPTTKGKPTRSRVAAGAGIAATGASVAKGASANGAVTHTAPVGDLEDITDPGLRRTETARFGDADDTMHGTLDSDATMIGRRPEFDHDDTTTFRPIRPRDLDADEDDRYSELEPPVPLLNLGTEEPDRDSSRLALSIVAGAVVLALILGFLGIRSLLSPGGGDEADSPSTGLPTVTSSSSPGATTSTSSTAAQGQVIPIKSITSFDPEGDNNEHDELARRAIDNDPQTVWQTHVYGSGTFGRTKEGAGLILTLDSPQPVRSVKVSIEGASSDMTVYVTDQTRLRGAKELGKISGSGEQTASAAQPVTGRYVIVWITRLSEEGSRAFRDKIAEVGVTS